jgi:Sulfotransferase family
MLCQHPNATCLTFAESIVPFASVSRPEDILTWKDWRSYYSLFASLVVQTLRPMFKYMFKFGATQPMEEIQLGAVVFGSSIFLTQMYLPSYDKWFKESDHTPMESYVKLMLKVVQYQRGGEQKLWILKSPQNADQLGPKTRVYQDSAVVLMHRESVPVISSMVGMVCYTVGVFCDTTKVDYRALARLWVDHQRWSLVEGLSPENVLTYVEPLSKLMNIRFQDFMKDPVDMALRVAKHAGLSVNDDVKQIFEEFHRNSPREGANVLQYDLESFGISEDEVRSMYAPYEKEYLS